MTSKFSEMNEAFSRLYGRGATFEEICDRLGISIPTAQIWRKKLGLQPRSGRRGPISWMDERRIRGKSYREVLQQIAGPIGLTSKDIEFILSRFDKLKSKGKTRGRPHLHLILAAAYLYLRWESSGRDPKSPKSFMFVCKTSGFKISRSALLMSSRLFNEAGLYPQVRLTPQQLLGRLWKSLAAEYKLPESIRT